MFRFLRPFFVKIYSILLYSLSDRAVEFWRQQAVELGLPFHVFSPGGVPVCVLTVLGTDPSLRSIMLNSHMDVVPAVEVKHVKTYSY